MIKLYKKIINRLMSEERNIMMENNAKLISTALLHQKTFLPYKNYCKGEKDLVVCGAGPSLQNYEPIEGAIHIAVNRAFLCDKVNFDFIFAQDFEGIKMVQDELVRYRPKECVKFLGNQVIKKKQIPESLALKCDALRFDTNGYIYIDGRRGQCVLDIDSRPICNMMNVGQSVMQLALYMNPKRLYIVGCDMSGTHFAKGNQTEAEVKAEKEALDKLWVEKHNDLIKRWLEIKEFARVYYPDVEIISINPVGLKGIFEDVYQT